MLSIEHGSSLDRRVLLLKSLSSPGRSFDVDKISSFQHPFRALAKPSATSSSAAKTLQEPQHVAHHRILIELGKTRRSKAEAYVDAAALDDPSIPRPSRGGFKELFPNRLHNMLQALEEAEMEDVASFFHHGRSFRIHHEEYFCKEILPKYFFTTKMDSFNRQLRLYGFLKIKSGYEKGGFYHPLFLRGRLTLAHFMTRVGAPSGNERRTTVPVAGPDPNFDKMPPVL